MSEASEGLERVRAAIERMDAADRVAIERIAAQLRALLVNDSRAPLAWLLVGAEFAAKDAQWLPE